MVNLQGICSGQLPQYATRFNGQGSYAEIQAAGSIAPTQAVTLTAWIKPTASGNIMYIISEGPDQDELYSDASGHLGFAIRDSSLTIRWAPTSNLVTQLNRWQFVAVTYNGVNAVYYLNGASDAQPAAYGNISPLLNNWCIGCEDWGMHNVPNSPDIWFNGQVADVQVYNTSLSTSDIQALYVRGIGAAPQNLQSLVGWWPLNGDTNDYSGNNNNGAPVNIVYSSQWLGGYTPP
jgi:hypothetical protein